VDEVDDGARLMMRVEEADSGIAFAGKSKY
jgi:hypothetical protein